MMPAGGFGRPPYGCVWRLMPQTERPGMCKGSMPFASIAL